MSKRRPKRFQVTPRAATTGLGAWLAVSAVAWQHSFRQQVSCAAAGLITIVLGRISRRHESAHRATLMVGAWILLSLFLIWPGQSLTAWNNLLIGISISALATMDPDRPLWARSNSSRGW